MKKIILSTLLLSMCTGAAFANEYKLDPSHSNARFNIDHFGTSTNHGGFYNIEGIVTFNPEKQTGAAEVIIPTATIDTGSQKFTEHMKSTDILDTEKFETITFKSTEWVFDGPKPIEIKGELTMMGKTNPITLKATKFNCYDSPMFKTEVCGGDFSATIDRTEWGIDFFVDSGMTKNVDLQIQVEAVKQ